MKGITEKSELKKLKRQEFQQLLYDIESKLLEVYERAPDGTFICRDVVKILDVQCNVMDVQDLLINSKLLPIFGEELTEIITFVNHAQRVVDKELANVRLAS